MTRRTSAAQVVVSRLMAACLLIWIGAPAPGESASASELAVTVDDIDINGEDTILLNLDARNQAILSSLRHSNLKAALFVCGMRVDNPEGKKHLLAWSQAGHLIGNHSYSHLYFPRADVEQFSADVLRGERVIENLPQFRKLFRFPYLKEGATLEQRDRMRSFLESRGYRPGYVTIDTSDWAIDARLRQKLRTHPPVDLEPYKQFYLAHVWERASYYDQLATDVLGRDVKHTLLIHHNLLNALFLDDLLRMFKARGWKLMNAEEAFADPVFSTKPDIVPAGESIIWAIAKETGRFDARLRYPAEDGKYEEPRMNELGL